MKRNYHHPPTSNVGRRTGLTIPSTLTFTADDGLENPETLFNTAVIVEESPNGSLDGSLGRDSHNDDTIIKKGDTTTLDTVIGTKKPKIKVRFSLGDEVSDQFVTDTTTTTTTIKAQHPVRKLISGKLSRESIDTMDLSSVSTAPSISSKHINDEENEVEAVRQHSDETEIAAIVKAAQKQKDQQQQLISLRDTSMISKDDGDVAYDDDDDDLVPPPPPDSPEHVDEVDDDIITQPVHDNDIEFPNPLHDNDDEDDDGNQGFEMPNDDVDDHDDDNVVGGEVINEQRKRREKSMEKLVKKARATSSDKNTKSMKPKAIHDDSAEDTPKPQRKPKKKINPYSTTFSPKGMPGPRTYTQIPISDIKGDSPEDKTLRRSKRARVPPLEFWRGEKPIFGGNDFGDEFDGVKNMPVVVGFAKPDPTPYKKRKVVYNPIEKKSNKKHRALQDDTTPNIILADEPYDSKDLRQKLPVNDGKVAHLWDERFQETRGIKVVSYVASAKSNDLPISKTRKKSEGKIVGKAAQSFQMSNEENPAFPGYIVGHLLLPPKGIKDAESVGLCAQVFTVVKAQAKSIEIAYGDPEHESSTWDPIHAERFLLSSGDNFLVPPGNSYRLQNHSKTTECVLSWTIIRHNPSLLLHEDGGEA